MGGAGEKRNSRRSVPAHKACREPQGGAQAKHRLSKNMGISGRVEGDKHIILWDVKKRSLGRQTGKRATRNLSPNRGTTVGQSPTRFREQTEWPIEGKAFDDERGKRT